MLRGILTGGLSGLVVGGTVLTGVSLMTELPAGNTAPVIPQVDAATDPDQTQTPSDLPQTVADDSTGDAVAAAVPQVETPEVTLTAPVADTSPAAVPQAGGADDLAMAPADDAAPSIDVATVDPVLPNPQSIAPQVPSGEQDIAVSTAPAALPEPTIEETPPEATPDPIIDPIQPDPPSDDAAAPETTQAAPAAIEGPAVLPSPEVDADDVATTQEAPVIVADVEPTPEPEQDAAPAPVEDPDPAPAEVSIVPDASSGLPAGDSGVAVRRLTDDTIVAPEQAETAVDPNAPAIEKYASVFENPENKPLISVILVDDGSLDGAVGAVASLELPVTVVLDADQPDAAAKMADYRAAGVEVAVRTSLPEGVTATDVETAFEASFARLPETVLLVDDGQGGLQNNRAITTFAMEALARDGRGFLTISSGLNTALRLAEQNDVPAAVIYRDLDKDDQDARVIRRFLDQAAFRARQDDKVFLMGRVRPDTLSALILWGSANRASQVVFAPASAALTAKAE